ncbi:Ribosomal RNA large subunit methyltransferase H [Candidatus Zixiibacteriota bacterium]|nr:Ribosomal RNA large subunit methyltransferase H [candidate division Zixibacteria bacterium]
MFRINIIAIGRNKDAWIELGIDHYLKLLRKSAQVNLAVIPDVKSAGNLSPQELRKAEANSFRKHLKSDFIIALSDRGRLMTSEEFADFLQVLMTRSPGCDFLIGGIYGLDESILKTSREIISLSPMTMSHRLIRPVLLEQIYRAFSIISGGNYHK